MAVAPGLYGTLAYGVVQRTCEIGIRSALGARRIDIMRLVTRRAAVVVMVGIVLGVAESLAVNQLVRSFIFGVTFYDIPTLLAVVIIGFGVVAVAALVPASRACRVDPTMALRWE